MDRDELKIRLKQFALRVIKLVDNMPKTRSGNALANQIIRSGTSPYANYCAACIGKSEKDFLNKLKMVEEELDETAHWLELIMDSGMIQRERLLELHSENLELLKIITRSIITMREKINKS
jgi:four helix bundle protein